MIRTPWRLILAVCGPLVAAYFLAPGDVAKNVAYDATGVVTVAAMVWGVQRHRPNPASSWWLLTVGLALFVAGDIAYDVATLVLGREPLLSVADMFYLGSYPVVASGVFGLLRARSQHRDAIAVLDALFAGVVFAAVIWVYLIEPARAGGPLIEELVSAAYPAMDALVVTVLIRLLFTSATPRPAERLLLASVGLLLAADVLYAYFALQGDPGVGNPAYGIFLASYLCRALAATHPSLRLPVAPAAASGPPTRSRLWAIAAAGLALPLLAALEAFRGNAHDALLLSVASAVGAVFLAARGGLVIGALGVAVDGNQKLLDRERILRSLASDLGGTPDRRGIFETAVEHACRLAGPEAEAFVLFGAGEHRALAATDRLKPLLGLTVDGAGIPPSVAAILDAGRSAMFGPSAGDPLHAALPDSLRDRTLVVAPLVPSGVFAGAVITALADRCRADDLTDAFESLGSTVSLALEAADLAENLLEERSRQRFGAMIDNSSDIIGLVRPDLTVQFVTPAVTRILGWDPAELGGTSILTLIHPDDVAAVTAVLEKALLVSGVYGPVACRARHRDGSWRPVEGMGTSLLDDPAVNGIVLNIRDVSERAHLQDELVHQAFHDPLTGLANRALFRDRVRHALAGAGRTGQVVEVLFLDLDDFKAVNDGLGHPVGDAVLVAVAERLAACVRAGDTVARLGGDEFAVLVADGGVAGPLLAERIVEALRPPILVGGQEVLARASIGLAAGPPGTAPTDLHRDADLAMYVAKAQGKDRWVDFRPEMLDGFLADLQLERDLRLALDRGEIEVRYQPIVDLASAGIIGAEALVRWAHPERGRVAPAAFIPVAERSGLILPIGRHVLRQACRDAARWLGDGGRSAFSVSVNVSARQLREPGLVDEVRSALADGGLAADHLVVEVTESLLLENVDATVERLGALRALGVRVSIDDFGTGYSSLSYLGHLPVDILKIDKSFVDGVAEGDDRNLVPAILELSRTLGLRTVAEGVETAAQATRLAGLGCPLAQGFFYSRPVPAAEMEPLLAAGRLPLRPALRSA